MQKRPWHDPEHVVTVALPVLTLRVASESTWPKDDPGQWERVRANSYRRRAGPQWVLRVSRRDLSALEQYLRKEVAELESVAFPRLGWDRYAILRACRTAIDRIHEFAWQDD
ncbi:hypothetical protein ABZ639_02500 [Saccharomonospora sp. NPDC006951]